LTFNSEFIFNFGMLQNNKLIIDGVSYHIAIKSSRTISLSSVLGFGLDIAFDGSETVLFAMVPVPFTYFLVGHTSFLSEFALLCMTPDSFFLIRTQQDFNLGVIFAFERSDDRVRKIFAIFRLQNYQFLHIRREE
jgi:hypothetical protein